MPKQIQNNEFLGGSPIMDATPQPNSTHAVQSGGVYTAFNNLSTEISAINSTLESIFRDNIFVATQQINMSELAWSNAKNSKYARVNLNVPSGAVLLDVGIDDFTSGDINVSIFNVMKKANDSIFIFNDTALTTGWVKINYTYAK